MQLRSLFDTNPDDFMTELAATRHDFLSSATAAELDATDPLAYTADLFELGPLVPFAGHSLGPGLKATRAKILATLDLQKQLHAGHFPDSHPEGHQSAHWFDCDREKLSLDGAQQLLGFKAPHEFCFTASGLSHNLGMLMETFYRPTANDWHETEKIEETTNGIKITKTRKTKIVMLDTEFFSDRAIAASVMKRAILTEVEHKTDFGGSIPTPASEVLTIKPDARGLYGTDQLIEFIRAHADSIQLLCLPDIVFSTGQRLQLQQIFAAVADCIREHQIKIILDLAHTVGNRPVNLSAMPITAAVGCAYKHLCGPAGSAFGIYVNSDVDLKLYPPRQGWKAADPEQVFGKINQYDDSIMEQKSGATAFRTSNPPPIALIPAQAFLTEMNAIGFDKLFAKSERLTRYLLAQLQQHLGDKIDIITPLNPAERGATLCLQVKGAVSLHTLEQQLKVAGYEIDTRPPNLIRMTAHYGYTTFTQIHDFVRQFKLILESRAVAEVQVGYGLKLRSGNIGMWSPSREDKAVEEKTDYAASSKPNSFYACR